VAVVAAALGALLALRYLPARNTEPAPARAAESPAAVAA
jgi:hypothetical protein